MSCHGATDLWQRMFHGVSEFGVQVLVHASCELLKFTRLLCSQWLNSLVDGLWDDLKILDIYLNPPLVNLKHWHSFQFLVT